MSMLYVIIGEDCENSLPKRKVERTEHLARLDQLRDQGRLVIAGPCPAIDSVDPGPAGFTGSIIIAEFDSLEDARTWAENDPYATAGIFTSVTVKPFKKVLP